MIGVGVHLYIYICIYACMYYVCDPPKSLNATLAVDSPFHNRFLLTIATTELGKDHIKVW